MTDPARCIPSRHLAKPGMKEAILHPGMIGGKTAWINVTAGVVLGGFMSLITAAMLEGVLWIAGMPMPWLPLIIGLCTAWMPAVWARASYVSVLRADDAAMRTLLKQSVEATMYGLRPNLEAEDPYGRQAKVKERIFEMLEKKDGSDEFLALQRRTIVRLASVERAHANSIGKVGSTSKDEVDAIRADALGIIVNDSIREHENLVALEAERDLRNSNKAIEAMRSEVSDILSMETSHAKRIQHSSGTGRAHIDRLVANAEKGLAIDPDMVDATGARVDAAVRRHLPRLLQKHADMALNARIEDLAETDRLLDEGVEQIRESVEEGLSSIRHGSAQALRNEIAFLKLRRADARSPLCSIDGKTA